MHNQFHVHSHHDCYTDPLYPSLLNGYGKPATAPELTILTEKLEPLGHAR